MSTAGPCHQRAAAEHRHPGSSSTPRCPAAENLKTPCLGLNGAVSFENPPAVDVAVCEPKMPCSRYTQNPATTTTTTTSSIHPRLSRRPIEILLTRKPFANRKMVRLESSSLPRFEREPTATPGTVRYRTGRDQRYRMGGRSVRVNSATSRSPDDQKWLRDREAAKVCQRRLNLHPFSTVES
jgi:hypothetical protein